MPKTSTPRLHQGYITSSTAATVQESTSEPEPPFPLKQAKRELPLPGAEKQRLDAKKPLSFSVAFLASLFMLLVLASGCEMQQDIEVDMLAHEPVTLVECYLEPGQPARLLATKSVGFFDTLEIMAADDLQVSLFENGRHIQLENRYYGDSLYYDIFNYISSDTVQFKEGAQWELVVHRQEEEIARGTARFLPKPRIKDISFTLSADSILNLSIQVEDDPTQENYYRLRVYMKNMLPSFGFTGLWNDQAATGNLLKISTGPSIKANVDSIIVSLYHIDKEYYTFLRSVQKAYDANYNPFAQPANLESNIQGKAMGIFTTISGVTDTIRIMP